MAQFELVTNLNSYDEKTMATYLAVSLGVPAQAVPGGPTDKDKSVKFHLSCKCLRHTTGRHTTRRRVVLHLSKEQKRQLGESLP